MSGAGQFVSRRRAASLLGLGALAAASGMGGLPLVLIRREVEAYRPGFDRLHWTRLEYANSDDGTRPLHALAIWPRGDGPFELLVVMHGYTESAAEYFSEGRFWAERGRFVLLPDLRGRRSELAYPLDLVAEADPLGFHIPGWTSAVKYFGRALARDSFVSAGNPDSCGTELLDISAAIEAARSRFGRLLRPGADIVGYSGGGSNALLAAARTPYLFDRVVALYPIVDFAAQFEYLARVRRGPLAEMRAWMGGTPDEMPARYAARNTLAVVGNLRHSSAWVFADREDPLCPVAIAEKLAASVPPGQPFRVMVSKPGDEYRWHHVSPHEHSGVHRFGELVFSRSQRLNQPKPARVESWSVAGYLRLPDVEIDLGNRQAGVVNVAVTRTDGTRTLEFEPVIVPPGLRVQVRVWTGTRWIERTGVRPEGRVEIRYR